MTSPAIRVDDADRLGPKGHVYVELVREQWRAPLERGTARRALITSALSIILIVFGVFGVFAVYGESVILVAIGLIGFVSSLGEVRALLPEFREARRVGWLEPALDDSSVTVGEPATFRAVLHARRALVLERATLRAEARRWASSSVGDVVELIELPVTETAERIARGTDWRQTVTFRIPPSAPPSYYSGTDSVRWTLTLELILQGEAAWRRTLPMLVFPADVA